MCDLNSIESGSFAVFIHQLPTPWAIRLCYTFPPSYFPLHWTVWEKPNRHARPTIFFVVTESMPVLYNDRKLESNSIKLDAGGGCRLTELWITYTACIHGCFGCCGFCTAAQVYRLHLNGWHKSNRTQMSTTPHTHEHTLVCNTVTSEA